MQWIAVFSPAQFLVFSMSEYLDNPGSTLLAISAHINIGTAQAVDTDHTRAQALLSISEPMHSNQAEGFARDAPLGFDSTMSEKLRARFSRFFDPYDRQLQELVASSGVQRVGSGAFAY
jgi:hypothetical protein